MTWPLLPPSLGARSGHVRARTGHARGTHGARRRREGGGRDAGRRSTWEVGGAGEGKWKVDRRAWLGNGAGWRRSGTTPSTPQPTTSRSGAISPTHRRFVDQLIQRCPPGGRILDAACGPASTSAPLCLAVLYGGLESRGPFLTVRAGAILTARTILDCYSCRTSPTMIAARCMHAGHSFSVRRCAPAN